MPDDANAYQMVSVKDLPTVKNQINPYTDFPDLKSYVNWRMNNANNAQTALAPVSSSVPSKSKNKLVYIPYALLGAVAYFAYKKFKKRR